MVGGTVQAVEGGTAPAVVAPVLVVSVDTVLVGVVVLHRDSNQVAVERSFAT